MKRSLGDGEESGDRDKQSSSEDDSSKRSSNGKADANDERETDRAVDAVGAETESELEKPERPSAVSKISTGMVSKVDTAGSGSEDKERRDSMDTTDASAEQTEDAKRARHEAALAYALKPKEAKPVPDKHDVSLPHVPKPLILPPLPPLPTVGLTLTPEDVAKHELARAFALAKAPVPHPKKISTIFNRPKAKKTGAMMMQLSDESKNQELLDESRKQEMLNESGRPELLDESRRRDFWDESPFDRQKQLWDEFRKEKLSDIASKSSDESRRQNLLDEQKLQESKRQEKLSDKRRKKETRDHESAAPSSRFLEWPISTTLNNLRLEESIGKKSRVKAAMVAAAVQRDAEVERAAFASAAQAVAGGARVAGTPAVAGVARVMAEPAVAGVARVAGTPAGAARVIAVPAVAGATRVAAVPAVAGATLATVLAAPARIPATAGVATLSREAPSSEIKRIVTGSPGERPVQPKPQIRVSSVLSAAATVAKSLGSGPWPSPYLSLKYQDIASRMAKDYSQHDEHMTIVASSLQQFASDVVLRQMTREGSTNEQSSKAFVGTLMILREVLTQNGKEIFGPLDTLPDDRPETPEIAVAQEQEDSVLRYQVLATSVILAGLELLQGIDSKLYVVDFLRMIELYDGDSDNVAKCMALVDENTNAVLPSGRAMRPEERLAWQISSNLHRDAHPVIKRRRMQGPSEGDADGVQRIQVPEANVCHISIFEEHDVE
jgi:hypothetical protein